ncbi:response regulator transcription factor [Streptomyces sp. ISL-11]|uniref:response regulator transcription factor n=1 Tax=Streptomyces sp. ISL-11 TaxID=2819174 RepID=UPI001BE85803|nr:LuxR C-terminal-related transcriptional regulator [Streptomyces sp. ISL-11]MBT2383500.1 helix-turn-helix transcriptional regulator [Streptomyces sp. ISL-11]
MSHLRARDYERMLDLAVAVLESDDPDSLRQLIAAHLLETFGCTTVIQVRIDAQRPTSGRADGWAPDSIGPSVETLVQRRRRQRHPLLDYLRVGGAEPVTMNQICDDWRNTECYSEARHDFGTTRQLGLPLPLPTADGGIRAISLGRKGRDFSARELAFAARIQPLLLSADNHAEELTRLRAPAAAGTGLVTATEHGLTPREQTVLGLVAQGLTADVIGRRLTISPHTVNRHLEKIYRKLGTNNRVSTVVQARHAGLVP